MKKKSRVSNQSPNTRGGLIGSLVLFGLIYGFLLTFSPGAATMLIVFTLTAIAIYSRTNESCRNYLFLLFLFGIGTRVVFLFLSHTLLATFGKVFIIPHGNTPVVSLFGDSAYYTARSWWLSQMMQGTDLPVRVIGEIFEHYGYSHLLPVLSLFHLIFGFSPTASVLINIFLSTITALLVFSMVKKIFSLKVAKLSSIFVMFFPSLFIWSLSNLKETLLILIIVLSLFLFMQFFISQEKKYLLMSFPVLALLPGLRKGALPPMVITLVVTMFILWKKSFLFKALLLILFGVIFLANIEAIDSFAHKQIVYIAEFQKGATSAGFSYRLLDPSFYSGRSVSSITYSEFFWMIPPGLIHFCFEPFPWNLKSMSMLAVYPQNLLWYVLVFFSVIGVLIGLRYSQKGCLVLFFYLVFTTLSLSVTGGNIGTDFRHRDVLTPVVIIFASRGLLKIFGKPELDQTLDKKVDEGSL